MGEAVEFRERALVENFENRRLGLEQEFFLVDTDGFISDRADEFLEACHGLAYAKGIDEDCFAAECVLSTVEISTPPASGIADLEEKYLSNLRLATEAARGIGLRLYPLATYPLPVEPTLRAEPPYMAQALTMGPERFRHAGRCAGVHLHLEMPKGALHPETGVSSEASEEAVRELLGAYNLATALAPAIVALTRSCPFYQGAADGLAARTTHYQGDADFAPHGLYAALPVAGGLRPYADTASHLSELQLERHRAWISTVRGSGLDSSLFEAGNILKTAWNPVRLNAQDGIHGTLELRGIDSNYPSEVMSIASLITACENRIREDGRVVIPDADSGKLEVHDGEVRVPDFDFLSGRLLREAASRGLESPEMLDHLESVFELAGNPPGSERFQDSAGYRNVERDILNRFPASRLGRDEGLALVREACDELEHQIESFHLNQREAAKVGPL